MNKPRVLLLNMPFVSLSRPSLGISLLKARLAEEGIECHLGYANLLFAEQVGLEAYDLIDNKLSLALFPGDWLFSQFAFGQHLDLKGYTATLRANCDEQENFDVVMKLRDDIGPFLKTCLERWDFQGYEVIGFTTTFQQNLASLVLAGLIRERFPTKLIVFGGANCEGDMGIQLHKSFQWIDYVCSGESDFSFPELVKRLAAGKPVKNIPGLVYRDNGQSCNTEPVDYVRDMDALPDPDFKDYFEALESSPLRPEIKPSLLIETSRGCWWGAKAHCTFCGLNGSKIAFRAKSAERALGEIERQVERHGIRHFQAVDNIIPKEYFDTLLPMLKDRQLGVSFFYETKANLTRKQVKSLREAGVIAIQPGIESLSTHVLKLMRKGVTTLQNIQLLKWCREYGVEVAWNLIFGFPGEMVEDYEKAAVYMSAIPHLRPPGSVKPIRLDRFSPNFNQAESFGIVNVRPFAIYRLVYPFPPAAVFNLAYYFEYDYVDHRKPDSYARPLVEQAEKWKKNGDGNLVKKYDQNSNLIIVDTRHGRKSKGFVLKGLQREIYEFCEEIQTKKSIIDMVIKRVSSSDDVEAPLTIFLKLMEEFQLMVREGDRYLSVAVSEKCLPVLVGCG